VTDDLLLELPGTSLSLSDNSPVVQYKELGATVEQSAANAKNIY
jgi:hypothetical protein